MDKSKYADLFETIFGFRPKKTGHSYELLVAAAIKAVLPSLQVKANQYIAGTYSGEKYQLDALIESLEKIMVEAKDYSQDDRKVGRPDVSKMAGALNDLPIDGGIVASPTDFSRHAKMYAHGTKSNPKAKPIDLYHVRESTEEDERGRIKTVHIHLLIESPDFKNAQWRPVITKEGNDTLKEIFAVGTQIKEAIWAFYRGDGSEITTIWNLTRALSSSQAKDGIVKGDWIAPEPAFIKIAGRLIPIESFKYEFKFQVTEHQMIIEAQGKAILLEEISKPPQKDND